MKNNMTVDSLFQIALKLELYKFDSEFDKLEKELSFDEFWEAYLIRAQLKLYISDSTFLDDLLKAESANKLPIYPLLNSKWRMDSSNQYSISHSSNNDLLKFKDELYEAYRIMKKLYGDAGSNTILEFQCELVYFQGKFEEAIELLKEIEDSNELRIIDELFLYFFKYRVNLAYGNWEVAEASMLEVIKLSAKYPECQEAYQQFKGWAILTTNWNGDSPRFIINAEGDKVPNLEDRLVAIKEGADTLTLKESVMYEYAKLHFEEVYTQRMFYMDIFNAMYWFIAGDSISAINFFNVAYDFAQATEQITPFIEYGEHIVPLIHFLNSEDYNYNKEWLKRVERLSIQYENSLSAYQKLM